MFVFLPPELLLSISIILVVHVQPRFAQDELSATHGPVIFSSVFFRHGDRAPLTHYLTREESHWTTYWPQGVGNLSRRGKQQMKNLGMWFQGRYQSLIAQEMAAGKDVGNWLSMDSSNTDRSIDSAKLFLHGFVYPEDGTAPDDVLNFQPPAGIQFHPTIDFHEVDCPRYAIEMGKMNEDYAWINSYLTNKTAFDTMYGKITPYSPQTIVEAFEEAYSLHDTFVIERSLRLLLQPWADSIFPNPIRQIAKSYFHLLVWNNIMKRLRCGPLIKEVIQDMELKYIAGEAAKSFHFYSGQDFTLYSLLLCLGVYTSDPPSLGSALIFELRESQVANPIVTVSYKNADNAGPYLLQIPGCEIGCSFEHFKDLVRNLVPVNWQEDCYSEV